MLDWPATALWLPSSVVALAASQGDYNVCEKKLKNILFQEVVLKVNTPQMTTFYEHAYIHTCTFLKLQPC